MTTVSSTSSFCRRRRRRRLLGRQATPLQAEAPHSAPVARLRRAARCSPRWGQTIVRLWENPGENLESLQTMKSAVNEFQLAAALFR